MICRQFRCGALALTGLFVGFAAQAQQVVVNGVPSGTSVTALPSSLPTITVAPGGDVVGAVNEINAMGGGNVVLQAGVYNITQSITPGSNVAIIGAGPSTVILAPKTPNGIAMIAVPGGGVSNLIIKNLVLDGNNPKGAFLVNGTGGGNPYSNSGIYLIGSNATINNVDISYVEIRNTGIGILATVTNSITFDHAYIHDNNPGNFAHNAYLVGCQFVYITHSRFNNAHLGDGLHFDFSSSYYVIEKSEFSNNNGIGVLDQGSTSINISDTIFDGNTNEGDNSSSSGGTITRSRANTNGSYGFDVQNGQSSNYVYGFYDTQGVGYFTGSFGNLYFGVAANQYPAFAADGVIGATDTATWTTTLTGTSAGLGAVDFNAKHLSDGVLTFSNVSVPSSGNYGLTMRYANGGTATDKMNLTINGVAQPAVSFPPTGGTSTWAQINLTVPLVGANNIISWSVPAGATHAPELDQMGIAAPAPVSPAAPTNVVATPAGPYEFDLTWPVVPGAGNYGIIRDGRIIAANVVGNSYNDTGLLVGGAAHSYAVFSINQAGGGPASATINVQSPVDAPAGLQVSAGSTGNALNWMTANGAISYTVKRSNTPGGPYAAIASVTNTTSYNSTNSEQYYTDTTAVSGTAYYYVVSSVGAAESSNSYEVSVPGIPATTQLLTTSGDVGPAPYTVPGTSAYAAATSTYTLTSQSYGIWNTIDSFRYIYMPVTGDMTMTARVTSETASSIYTEAGIEFRETLDQSSTEVFSGLLGNGTGAAVARSGSGNGSGACITSNPIKPPYWTRLTRSGSLFTSLFSPDGTTWTVLCSGNIPAVAAGFVGLGVASWEDAPAATATFDNVTVVNKALQ